MKKERDPFDWNNISIEKYYDILDILNDEEDDDITKNVRMTALILDKDESEVWDMSLTEAGEYISRLRFLNKFDIPAKPNMNIKLPGFDLKVMKDVTKINVAQYVDFQSFIKMPLKESMDKILSIFLIPEGHKYNEGYDILEVQKTIRENMSFRVAESLLGFFLKAYGESLLHSLVYCKRQIRKTKNPEMMQRMEEALKETQKKLVDLTHLTGSF